MSIAKKGRKLQSNSRNQSHESSDPAATFAESVGSALRSEFGNQPSMLKTVAKLTQSNERAVRNWFEGKNAPNGENLVILMRHSDAVLKTILGRAGRQDLVVAVGLVGLRRQLIDAIAIIDGQEGADG